MALMLSPLLPRRYLADIRTERVVLGAFADARQVAGERMARDVEGLLIGEEPVLRGKRLAPQPRSHPASWR